ncbi:MAG: response regulator [Verrucomicrobiota bacterium]
MTTPLGRILFAEDSPLDVEMTLAALEEHRIANEVVVVSDGQEAIDYLTCTGSFAGRSDGNPILVLLDLKMPRVNGLEVLHVIKQDERLRAIPVVMLTSSREEPDLVRSYQLGVNAYIVKPVDVPSFIDAVKQLGIFWAIHNALPRAASAGASNPPPPATTT